jgi:HK97 family phage portal protein
MLKSLFTRQTKPETPAPVAEEVRSLADPSEWLSELFGSSPSGSGVTVSPTTAMRAPAVRAAVTAISEACGQLPLCIVETAAGGLRKPAENHPLHPILNGAANSWTPAPAFREQLVRDALLHGAGFAWIGRDGAGTVRELIRIRPGDLQVDEDVTDILGPPVYRLRGLVVDRSNVVHLRCPLGPTGAAGIGPTQEAREAIGLALALEQTEANLIRNASRPGGILTFGERLTPEQLVQRKKVWQATYGGVGKGGTAVVDAGGKFDQVTFNLVDSQFEQLRQFQLQEIARAFRVPPVLLQDYGRATWANSAEMGRQFVNFTLQPWLLRIEGELSLKLFTEEERTHLVLEHDTDMLTNADPVARAQAAQAFRSAGVMTANELRRLENLPPHPDGDALTNPYVDTAKAPTDPTTTKPGDTTNG